MCVCVFVCGVRAAGPALPCSGYWAKFSRLLSGPAGGSDGIFQREKITEGWRAKRCRTAQGDRGEGERSDIARRSAMDGLGVRSIQGWGMGTVWAAGLCYRARPAGGSRGGVGEAAAGSPSRRRFLLSVLQKKYQIFLCSFATCRPPSQKTISLSI